MVITEPEQITPAWLGEVLIRNGTLNGGHIHTIEIEPENSANSRVSRLRLTYTADAQGELPATLFLKLCSGDNFGISEVEYYTRDYVGLANAPIPRCYDAQYTAEDRAYHILMEDLQPTHERDCPPPLEMGLAAADAFAALHAHWWGADRLRQGGVTLPTRSAIDTYIGHIRLGLQPLLDALGDDADPAWKPALIDAFDHHPALMIERLHAARDLTLIHGDPNPGNIMWAKSGVGKLYLIDRQPFDWSLTVWLGISDLTYMMVTWWDAEVRRPWQLAVLHRYHEQLLARGVQYSWDQLWYDYRLAAVQALYIPPQWCANPATIERARWLWQMQLGRAMRAYVDLECDKLWRG